MKEQNINKYCKEFINAAISQDEALMRGDSKTANRQYTIIKRIFNKAQKDSTLAKLFYRCLRNHDNANVRSWACAHSLALKIDITESEYILNEISKDYRLGIVRLSSEMTLKVLKEQGYLKF